MLFEKKNPEVRFRYHASAMLNFTAIRFSKSTAETYLDSDVISELYQIQDLLEPHNKSPGTFPQKTQPHQNTVIQFMNLVWHGKGTGSEWLPCQSCVTWQSLSCHIALLYLIQILF